MQRVDMEALAMLTRVDDEALLAALHEMSGGEPTEADRIVEVSSSGEERQTDGGRSALRAHR